MPLPFWKNPLADVICDALFAADILATSDRTAVLETILIALDRSAYEGVAARIVKKVVIDPETGCWIWPGRTRRGQGYGAIRILGRSRAVHRVSYEVAKGPIPLGLVIDHLCRQRRCC